MRVYVCVYVCVCVCVCVCVLALHKLAWNVQGSQSPPETQFEVLNEYGPDEIPD